MIPVSEEPGRQLVQVFVSLPPLWETLIELLAPNFGLAQSWLSQAFGEVNQLSLSLLFHASVCVYLSTSINTCKNKLILVQKMFKIHAYKGVLKKVHENAKYE